MTISISYNAFVDAAQAIDGDVRLNYGGRGMYGTECPGITIDGGNPEVRLAFALTRAMADVDGLDLDEALDVAEDIFDGLRTDNMGLGTILYFPRLALTGAPNDEES